ncbi:MAG: tRNA1(Val) (adenine(37)-N6)-methyltransferase [Actinobacteria bacterium]|nr:tRNA1(Val) (adenine(37)-N6)-methyltransferase [Actinomycetota bacterium]
MILLPGERLDDLGRGGLKIIQKEDGFAFGADSVLLAHFVTVRPGERAIDLGTGTAVIPLLLSALTRAREILGVEIEGPVAERAARSVSLNRLEGRLSIREMDLREAPAVLGHGGFDVVTANPPYRPVGSGKISPDRGRALARHEIACTLDEVVRAAAALVKFGGRVAMVHLSGRLPDVLGALRANRLEPKRLRMVYPYPGRTANLTLVEAVKGGRPHLEVLEPLYVRNESGAYSRELKNIYGEE